MSPRRATLSQRERWSRSDRVRDATSKVRSDAQPLIRLPRAPSPYGRRTLGASSAPACRASTAGRRSRAPICSAPTPRRPMRCGCASCARRMRARPSRSAISTPSSARTPGLVAILTAEDVPGENSFGIFPQLKDQPVLAPGHVRFRGEAVLALVGTREAVESVSRCRPADRLDAAAGRVAASMRRSRAGAPALHAHAPDNVLTRGNLEMRRCRRRPRRRPPPPPRAASRPRSSSTPTSSRKRATPCRGRRPHRGRRLHAGALHGPRRRPRACSASTQTSVRIRPTACGGGFGGKLDVSVQPLLAVAARVTARPVRIVYSRTESMASTTKRHPARIWAKASADARRPAHRLRDARPISTPAPMPPGGRRSPTACRCTRAGPTRCRTSGTAARAIYTNDTPAGAFRGFGVPQAAIAHETLMDDLAEALGLDRWAHPPHQRARPRRRARRRGRCSTHSAGLPRVPRCAEGRLGRRRWRASPRYNAAPRARRRGVGIACMWYGCGNTSLPNPSTMRITLARDGTAHLLQRRRRHRPGLDHRAAADRRRRARPAAGAHSSWWSATPT